MAKLSVEEIRKAQRAEGTAAVLAIGTANPSNYVSQADYPDFYFRITNSEHQTKLKDMFSRICAKSTIKKRHMYLTEEILQKKPNICEYAAPSLDARQDMVVAEVPKLAKEAAAKAIKEWGQPKSRITHVVFCTTSGVNMPGADLTLIKLLGLNDSVNRFMLYQQGCFGGGSVLRLAKDLAENNKGSRVLAVCSEMVTAVCFRGPSETHLDLLVGQAIFGDGAAAVIVGSDFDASTERPIFELVSPFQTTIPDTDSVLSGHLREAGLTFHLSKELPGILCKNIEQCLVKAFNPVGVPDWNSIFWIAHPGGPAILTRIESQLGLKDDKLRATRHVLSEYGNLSSASVLFIMDEMRKHSLAEGKPTTGEGLDWGVLFGFGPGVTIEAVVLRSVCVPKENNTA